MDSLPKGAVSIEGFHDEVLNSPRILAKVRAAEAEHFSALISDCLGDPALDAAREFVRIPVIEVAQGTAHLAAQLAPRFSIINAVHELAYIDRDLNYDQYSRPLLGGSAGAHDHRVC